MLIDKWMDEENDTDTHKIILFRYLEENDHLHKQMQRCMYHNMNQDKLGIYVHACIPVLEELR